MKKILICLSCWILITACNRTIQVDKRRYSKGFYISLSARHVNHDRVESKVAGKKRSLASKKDTANHYTVQKDTQSVSAENNVRMDSGNRVAATVNDRQVEAFTYAGASSRLPATLHSKINQPQPAGTLDIAGKRKAYTDGLFLLGSGFLAFVSFAFFRSLLGKTKKMALWAKLNPAKAKGALACIQTALITGGIFAGRELHHHDIIASAVSTHTLLAATAAVAFLSPVKNLISHGFRRRYKKQKTHFFMVAMLSFLLFVNIGSRTVTDSKFSPFAALFHSDEKGQPSKNLSSSKTQTVAEHPEKKTGKMILRISLTILLSLIGFALICAASAFACELACMDEMALAILVVIGGMGLTACLIIFAMEAIWRTGVFKKRPVVTNPTA